MNRKVSNQLREIDLRIQELLRIYEASALEVYQKYFTKKVTPEEYFSLVSLDPTANIGQDLGTSSKGKYSDWLTKQYVKLGKKPEFLKDKTLKDGLVVVNKLMNNKDGQAELQTALTPPPANLKDINSYSVEQIQKLAPMISSENLGKKKDKQVEIVFNDDNLFVVHPLTHEAARKFGTGTKWCTATSNASWFKKYNKYGLYIIINKRKPTEKWQYCKNGDFALASDIMISISGWYLDQIKIEENGWGDSVDEMAQVLEEKVKAPHWSLERLHSPFSEEVFQQMSEIVKTVAALPEKERSYFNINGELPLDVYAFYLLDKDISLEFMTVASEKLKTKSTVSGVVRSFQLIKRAKAPRAERLLNYMNYAQGQDPEIIAKATERAGSSLPIKELTSNMEILRFFLLACKNLSIAAKMRFVNGGPTSILTSDRMFKALQTERDADSALKSILAEFFKNDLTSMQEVRQYNQGNKNSMEQLLFSGVETEIDPKLATIISKLKKAYEPLRGGLPKTFHMLETLDFNETEDYTDKEVTISEPLKVMLPREIANAMLGKDYNFDIIKSAAQIEGKAEKFNSYDLEGCIRSLVGAGQKKLFKYLSADPNFDKLLAESLEEIILAIGEEKHSFNSPLAKGLYLITADYYLGGSSVDSLIKVLGSQPQAKKAAQELFNGVFEKAKQQLAKEIDKQLSTTKDAITKTIKKVLTDEELIQRFFKWGGISKKILSAAVGDEDSFKIKVDDLTRGAAKKSSEIYQIAFDINFTFPFTDILSLEGIKHVEQFDAEIRQALIASETKVNDDYGTPIKLDEVQIAPLQSFLSSSRAREGSLPLNELVISANRKSTQGKKEVLLLSDFLEGA